MSSNKIVKEELLKQIEELKQKVEKMDEEEEKFKFCRRGYGVWIDGDTSGLLNNDVPERGRFFSTEALAVKYDKIITNSYKIAQAVAQLVPGYEPDWSEGNKKYKYFLVYDTVLKMWTMDSWVSYNPVGVVLFPESISDQMLELANSGQLNLEV